MNISTRINKGKFVEEANLESGDNTPLETRLKDDLRTVSATEVR